ncbi:MAG: aminopeptidase P family protein [Nitrosopumilus sp.]|nr:aminopeptidase P family protein [Nitrosopumilus sp.]
MDGRKRRLLGRAKRAGFGGLAALEPENLFYMTGFWGEAAGLLTPEKSLIIAPGLEVPRARAEAPGFEVVEAPRGSGVVPALARAAAGARLCTDCRGHADLAALRRRSPGAAYLPAPFEECRVVKDAGEARAISAASRLVDELFGDCARLLREGGRESELQSELMARAAALGLHDTGYHHTLNPLIVAGGPNGALPHAQPGPRRFRRGDMVVVDITLRRAGYISDATRTFAVGRAPREAADSYAVVKESQRAGLRAARAGASCSSVDAACRGVIEESGRGPLFIHSTGHGVGLEVHEAPAISPGARGRLQKNMAITVEPGVYVEGSYGIRIEDTVLVGSRPLHRFTKDLVEV